MKKLNLTKKTVDDLVQLNEGIYKRDRKEVSDGFNADDLLEFFSRPDVVRLHEIIYELSDNEFQELAAMTWQGRGYGGFETFEDDLDHASSMFPPERDNSSGTDYLSSKPLFKYLPSAIEKLRAEGFELSE
jgi:hypothetical protein